MRGKARGARFVAIALAVAASQGCGKVSGAADAAVTVQDAAGDADTDTGTSPQGACDLAKPFGSIVELSTVSTTLEDSAASLTADELTMYLSSRPSSGPSQILVATRADAQSSFGLPAVLGAVSIGDCFSPSITADGLTMYLISNTTGTVGGHDVFVATRATQVAAFGAPSDVDNINSSNDNEYFVSVTGSGNDIYFNSARGGLSHIYHAVRTTGSFGTASEVTEIADDTLGESSVAVRADGLEIYFGSQRTGSAGSDDIWMARRTSISVPFGTPVNVTELNSTSAEYPTWISSDGCRILFASTRPGGKGDRDIWMATRPK